MKHSLAVWSLSLVVGCLAVAPASRAADDPATTKQAKVYYLRWSAETYKPLTPTGIQRPEFEKTDRVKANFQALLALLKERQTGSGFDRDKTRLRVDLADGSTILVDQKGRGVLKGRQFKLAAKSQAQIDALLSKASR